VLQRRFITFDEEPAPAFVPVQVRRGSDYLDDQGLGKRKFAGVQSEGIALATVG
jgi:hypothetical protein